MIREPSYKGAKDYLYVLSTGRKIFADGMALVTNLKEIGYPSEHACIWAEDRERDDNFTDAELREIADYQIALWTKFKEAHQ